MASATHSAPDPVVAAEFFDAAFGHELLHGHFFGASRFPPKRGVHVFYKSPSEAAEWAVRQAADADVYWRTTPVLTPPAAGKRGDAMLASAIVGVHGDIDIADPVHKKGNLPPDQAAAESVIGAVGLEPTIIVHSGHGLQAHWLLTEPFVFGRPEDHARATDVAAAFHQTLAAAARSIGGWDLDNVGELARVLRVPGTLNRKSEPVPVVMLKADGPRYTVEDIEGILVCIEESHEERAQNAEPGGGPSGPSPSGAAGFDGTDDELLAAARKAKHGDKFAALFDRGELAEFGGDHSKADWHLAHTLAFWSGPNVERVDRLFRRSKLMRAKWDERHASDGSTYGQMTIADVLSKRSVFLQKRSTLPRIVVNIRQLREETGEAISALELLNAEPVLFQRGSELVRIRHDVTLDRTLIQSVTPDHVIEMLSRAADFVQPAGDRWVSVRPPLAVARNILSLPAWRFPVLRGVVAAPRIRPDGSVLCTPGYDSATQLVLHPIDDLSGFAVPERPTREEVQAAVDLIDDVLQDFLFVDLASRANLFAFLLTPILRPAIPGSVPICAFDALSKQATGKSLLLRTAMIIATGREPSMSAVPATEEEFAKTLVAVLLEGRDVVVFDNAVGFVESGVWANAVTSPIFDNRLLGQNKQVQLPVRNAWAISGNSLTFGADLARRCYLVMQDAGVERPEERTDFAYELPAYVLQNRLAFQRAALTVARSWWANGCPEAKVLAFGSFEGFTRVVGGVLLNAGIVGFLENRREFRQHAETERNEWHGFVESLARVFTNSRAFTCGEIVTAIDTIDWLLDALPARLADAREKKANFATRLGKAVRDRAGAVFGTVRLESLGVDSHTKKPRYRVLPIDPPRQSAGGAGGCGASPYPPMCESEDIPV